MQEFKELLKAHSDNVQQRQQRVSRYGGSGLSREAEGGTGGIAALSQNYAMFSHSGPLPPPTMPVAPAASSAELRRRNVSAPVAASSVAQQQVQMTRARYQQEESFRSAQKVEASLAQVTFDWFAFIGLFVS